MRNLDEIREAIRSLPLKDRLRLVEEVVHDAADASAGAQKGPRPLGLDEGKGWVADDFDAPLPEDLQKLFDGES